MEDDNPPALTTGPVRTMAWLSLGAAITTMALKFGAWLATGSVGLLSDAMESFVNLFAALIALSALHVAGRLADARHPYGHDKIEYFSSGAEGALILAAALAIAVSAVQRLLDPAPLTALPLGAALGAMAALVNGGVAWAMLGVARRHDSIVLEADARHLFTDVWTTVAVLVGLGILYVAPPGWQFLDPLIALGIAAHILGTGIDLVRRSADGLMDAALPADELAEVKTTIREIAGPRGSFHALRSRKAGTRRFIEFHLLLPGRMSVQQAHDICEDIEHGIKTRLAHTSIVIHVEPREDPVAWDDPLADKPDQ